MLSPTSFYIFPLSFHDTLLNRLLNPTEAVLKDKIKSAALELAKLKNLYAEVTPPEANMKNTKDLMSAQWKLLRSYDSIDKEKASRLLTSYPFQNAVRKL